MFNSIDKILLLITGFFLVGAAVIVATGFRKNSSESVSELWRLYNSEWLIVAAIIIPAYLGGIYFLLAVIAFNFRSHVEIAYIHNRQITNPVVLTNLIGSTVIICLSAALGDDLYQVTLLQIVIAGLYSLICIFLIHRKLKQYIFSLMLICLVLLSLMAMLYINNMQNGLLLIVFLFVISETNDAFALLFGKIFGKRKIFPAISPQKTYAGLVAGILFSALAGLVFNSLILGYPFQVAFPVIILVITSVIFGDIVFSLYKRNYNLKDFKAVIRGQGGVLDIYDSLLTSGMVFYIVLVCMYGF